MALRLSQDCNASTSASILSEGIDQTISIEVLGANARVTLPRSAPKTSYSPWGTGGESENAADKSALKGAQNSLLDSPDSLSRVEPSDGRGGLVWLPDRPVCSG